MAPISVSDHDLVEQSVKRVIDDLYFTMIQVNAFDDGSRQGRDILQDNLFKLDQSIQTVHKLAGQPKNTLPEIPLELVRYVDQGRNPDIYTREFVEYVRKANQLVKGKAEAFGDFRDVLAQEMARGMPEVRAHVAQVLQETGGDPNILNEQEQRPEQR